MIIGYDCCDRPIRIGDTVEWVYDEMRPPKRRLVLGLADGAHDYPIRSPERGYLKVSDGQVGRGYHQRFGVNLRVVDSDFDMDIGL